MAEQKRAYLSPSGQIHNMGLDGVTEAVRAQRIANLAAGILRDEGVLVKVTPAEWATQLSDSKWLTSVVGASNSFGADAHVPIHTNAGPRSADGTDAWFYPGSTAGQRLAREVYNRVARVSPGSDGGLHTSPVFYETRAAKAPVAYVEMAFHTNPADVKSLREKQANYAEAIAEGILAFFGIDRDASSADEKPEYVPKAMRSDLTQLLLTYALSTHVGSGKTPIRIEGWHKVAVASDHWGDAKKRLAWRVSGRLEETAKIKQTAMPTAELMKALQTYR